MKTTSQKSRGGTLIGVTLNGVTLNGVTLNGVGWHKKTAPPIKGARLVWVSSANGADSLCF